MKKPKRKREPETFSGWISDSQAMQQWFSQYDLPKMLDDAGSKLCVVPNFLPSLVADGMLQQLEGVPEWNVQHSDPDYVETNISHAFCSCQVIPPQTTRPAAPNSCCISLSRALSNPVFTVCEPTCKLY